MFFSLRVVLQFFSNVSKFEVKLRIGKNITKCHVYILFLFY